MTMRIRVLQFTALFAVAALATGAARRPEPSERSARRHTALVKSVPAKDSTVGTTPEALELWFNQKIEMSLSKVQLVDAKQQPVALAPITRDDTKKDSPVVAKLMVDLPDGAYVVNWTAASADGHPVRGSYRFFVKSK